MTMRNFEIPKMTVSFFTKEEILTESTLIDPNQPPQLQAIDQFNETESNSLVGRASFTALMKVNE